MTAVVQFVYQIIKGISGILMHIDWVMSPYCILVRIYDIRSINQNWYLINLNATKKVMTGRMIFNHSLNFPWCTYLLIWFCVFCSLLVGPSVSYADVTVSADRRRQWMCPAVADIFRKWHKDPDELLHTAFSDSRWRRKKNHTQ